MPTEGLLPRRHCPCAEAPTNKQLHWREVREPPPVRPRFWFLAVFTGKAKSCTTQRPFLSVLFPWTRKSEDSAKAESSGLNVLYR